MNMHINPSPDMTPPPEQEPSRLSRLSAHGKSLLTRAFNVAAASVKFQLNKLTYGRLMNSAAPSGLVETEALKFYAEPDENGVHHGGNPHWRYVSGVFANAAAGEDEKYAALRTELAKLPGKPAFKFHSSPALEDRSIVRSAFMDSGFMRTNRATFLYTPKTENFDELVKEFKSDTRSKVKRAARELEITTMGLDQFFDFYRDNLQDKGKRSHFALKVDQDVLRREYDKPDSKIEIIAARRKSTPDNPGPHPMEAAILATRGEDGYYKLLRISYRVGKPNDPNPPHQQANKLLVTEAILRAAKIGATVDTDGFTPGGEQLYSRFGIFERHEQDVYKRHTLHKSVVHVATRLPDMIRKFA